MRRIRDDAGREWDVVLGHASWGAFQALFVPVGGGGDEVRSVMLEDDTRVAASRRLNALERAELLALLRSADTEGPESDGGGRRE